MLASVDPFLSRRRRRGYDCRHFLGEVWRAHTGEELAARYPVLMGGAPNATATNVRASHQIATPSDPCIVVFRRRDETHVGMFLRGNVLHLADTGPRFERLDLVAHGYAEVRFYR